MRSASWLNEAARLRPEALALYWLDRKYSFLQLAQDVEITEKRLGSLGVSVGARVAVLMDASSRFVEIVHALQSFGATMVALNTRLSATELAWQLGDCEPALLLYDAEHEASALAACRAAEAAGTGAPAAIEAGAELDAVSVRRSLPDAPGYLAAEVHSIIYTSGTTGQPKGVQLSHANHAASARASALNLGARSDDCWLALLPVYHVGGLSILLRSVLDGSAVVLQRGFDAAAANRAIESHAITHVSVVATMLDRMLRERDGAYPQRMRCVLAGGGPVPPSLLGEASQRGLPVAMTYGLTETASQVCTGKPGSALERPGASGRALPGTAIRIDAPDAEGCGEICVSGPTVMSGYFRRPEASAEVLRGGWLHTGDIGRLDADGFLYVEARRSDLIVSGGENVYPAEVEAALLAHPDVTEAGVYGEPDEHWGQRVAAAVVLRRGAAVDPARLTDWCRERMAGYKIPRSIRVVDSLPRTASGKLRRFELGAPAARLRKN